MMRRLIVLCTVVLLVFLGATSLGSHDANDQGDDPDALIVGFYELPSDRSEYKGERVAFHDEDLGYFVVQPDHAQGFQKQAKSDERVRYVQEDHADFDLHYEPNDELFPEQYGPQITDTPWAWSKTLGSTAVTIGFLDTGIASDHADFDATNITGWNYKADNSDISDSSACDHHGSHVSGIATALTDNEEGITGISNSAVIMQKMWDDGLLDCGPASASDFAQALKDLADQGAHISSNSWGGYNDQVLIDAIAYASDKGVIHVASTGNNGPCTDCVSEPWKSAAENVIIVTASDEEDNFATWSSEGPEVSVIAPGDEILSIEGDGYGTKSGTSMSVPHVSGAIALYIDANEHPGDHATMEQRVRDSADDLWLSEDQQGDGRLNTAILVHGDAIGPTAAFNSSCQELACSFDASASHDSHDDIVDHRWSFGENTTDQGELVEHAYASNNSYRVELTVANSTGSTDTTEGFVTASIPDQDTGQTRLFHDGFEEQTLWSWASGGENNLWRIGDDCVEPWSGGWVLTFSIKTQCNYDDGHVQGHMTTPLINASGLHDVTLSFAHFFEVENSTGVWDAMSVKVSDDGGRNYETLAQWDGRHQTNEAWEAVSLDVTPYASEELTVQFFFDSFDYLANDYLGWYIDEVEVQGTDPDGSMHVHDITMRSKAVHAWFDVTVYDADEAPLEDVQVTFEICPEGDACRTVDETTDGDGVADHRWKHGSGTTFTVCVEALEHPDAWWYPEMDHAEDGNCETGVA